MMNNRTPFFYFLALALILFASSAFSDQSNRYRPMAESMFDMMDAFSSTFQKRIKERDNDWIHRQPDQSSWLGGAPSWGSGRLPLNGPPLSPIMSPWSPGGLNYWPDPRGPFPQGNAPYYNWRPSWSEAGPLDGEWEDAAGSILSVGNGRFRIAQSHDRYSEGYLLPETGKILSMRTRNSDYKRYYEYAVQDDKLVLRDSSGNLLLFRRRNY